MSDAQNTALAKRLLGRLRDVPDFPSPGILFKDITPVLADPELMRDVISHMAAPYRDLGVTHVVAMESRGFLFGVPLALELGVAFVPARKPGKLPCRTERVSYSLEYGADELEIHADAIDGSSRVLVVDDVLATGGTAAAVCALVRRIGGRVIGLSMLLEIASLEGRRAVAPFEVRTVCAV